MLKITPSTHDLGAFEVRRTLPSKARTMVGPFIFVDQFGPAHFDIGAGMDVRPHPHINLATVTYLFEGAIEHRDSLGTLATIRPGALNLMTAGKGIVHSERTPAPERASGSPISGMQTWLALPDGKEEIDPAFEHVAKDDLPLIENDGVSARVIMGSLWGATAPTTQHAATIYADILMNAGASIPIDAEADERAVLVALGEAKRLSAEQHHAAIGVGGEAFSAPRHVWWNFVSSSRDRINDAKADWKAGKFPLVPGDDREFIPIPEVPLTKSA
jgi:redox-sensitive bicupin YhaK (pirin superfamily)